VDISVAAIVVSISCVVGTLVGTFASLAGAQWIDSVIARLVDALIAFPYLVVMLLLVVIIGPNASLGPTPRGLSAILVAFLVIDWTFYTRLARAQAASLRERDYVVAARTLGYSQSRIIRRHVLPSIVPVNVAYAVGDAILTLGALASFAFLGVGVQPPTAEWGNMMSEGSAYLQSAWWITLTPGLLLALTGLSFSLMADGLIGDSERERR
jgi:peptide/nickel transport system permease protein